MPPEDVAPEFLSEILLIQNMLPTLPDAESMLSFSCRGLEDLPGVGSVSYCLIGHRPEESFAGKESEAYPVHLGHSTFATIYCTIEDRAAFSQYEAYIQNLCFMIAARLEEQRQRKAAAELGKRLEREVRQRTAELDAAKQEAESERLRAERYLDAAETFVLELDRTGKIERVNQRAAALFELSPPELVGRNWFDVAIDPAEREKRREAFAAVLDGSGPLTSHEDAAVQTGSRETRFIHWHNIVRRDSSGTAVGMLSSGVDVTERKRAEEEKAVLLKEVYHRTKNNMHVISSLLSLQAASSQSDEVKASLLDAQSRIMAMALVHNMLYSSHQLAHLDLPEYINVLGSNLLSSYSASSSRIAFSVAGPQILVSLETAISCGIVLNEIMTNSAKHAFGPESRGARISIDLEEEEGVVAISYRDNGAGLPRELDLANSASLGMQIVHSIVLEQLQGELTVNGEGGFEATIRFPGERHER